MPYVRKLYTHIYAVVIHAQWENYANGWNENLRSWRHREFLNFLAFFFWFSFWMFCRWCWWWFFFFEKWMHFMKILKNFACFSDTPQSILIRTITGAQNRWKRMHTSPFHVTKQKQTERDQSEKAAKRIYGYTQTRSHIDERTEFTLFIFLISKLYTHGETHTCTDAVARRKSSLLEWTAVPFER